MEQGLGERGFLPSQSICDTMETENRKFFPGGIRVGTVNIQLRRKGILTLPVSLRRKYNLEENDVFTLEDLGNGSFLLIPKVSKVVSLGNRVAEVMAEDDVSLEEMLEALDKERQDYYREHYGQS
jgi:bifunctional DNA-binding transcriptional regulator/antitoxin component of YhaV-PrlF toxin-antitoxin module